MAGWTAPFRHGSTRARGCFVSVEFAPTETLVVSREQNGYLSRDMSFDTKLVDQRGIWDSGELIEISRCVFCANVERRWVAIRQDGLPIQECLSCGLAYVDPRPSTNQL